MIESSLIVDDNFYNRDLVRMALDTLGFSSDEAVNGRDALTKLQTDVYDILLLDIEMPEVNGIEVLRELRKDDRHNHMKVVLMTAYRDLAKDIERDVDYVVYKPIDINNFVVFLMKLKFDQL